MDRRLRARGAALAVAVAAVASTKVGRTQGAEHAYAEAMRPGLTVIAVIALADLGVTTFDLAADDPGRGWYVAQTVFNAPQAAILDVAVLAEPTLNMVGATAFNAWINDLAVYGPMRLADRQRPHWPAYGLSWAIGADIAVTTSILRSAFDDQLADPDAAVFELAVSAPQIAIAGVALHQTTWPSRPLLLGLGAAGSVFIVHGMTSLVVHAVRRPTRATAALNRRLDFGIAPASDSGWQLVARGGF